MFLGSQQYYVYPVTLVNSSWVCSPYWAYGGGPDDWGLGALFDWCGGCVVVGMPLHFVPLDTL